MTIYLKEFKEHFSKFNVFSINDAKIFLSKKGISREYLHLLVSSLLKKKELFRISRGIYSFKNDFSTLCSAFSPAYFGLQDALSIHGLWEQETNPVLITPRKIRSGQRQIFGTNVLIHRINRKMFFGFDLIKHFDSWIPVSDIEKTLIDFAYFNEPISAEVLKKIRKKIRANILENYLKKTPKITRIKVEKMLNLTAK